MKVVRWVKKMVVRLVPMWVDWWVEKKETHSAAQKVEQKENWRAALMVDR